jgi:hypothetical protein
MLDKLDIISEEEVSSSMSEQYFDPIELMD